MIKNIHAHNALYTIGHSTRTLDELIDILKHYEIQEVIDVRTIPRSRTNPQFNSKEFATSLHNHHIGYHHMKDLGGLRHAHKDSINTAWHNLSFRGYADYMQTPEFAHALEKLIEISKKKLTIIMCAEALPWRCHRSLIGDALLIKHIKVIDVFSATSAKEHLLTPWAKVKDGQLYYPEEKS